MGSFSSEWKKAVQCVGAAEYCGTGRIDGSAIEIFENAPNVSKFLYELGNEYHKVGTKKALETTMRTLMRKMVKDELFCINPLTVIKNPRPMFFSVAVRP